MSGSDVAEESLATLKRRLWLRCIKKNASVLIFALNRERFFRYASL